MARPRIRSSSDQQSRTTSRYQDWPSTIAIKGTNLNSLTDLSTGQVALSLHNMSTRTTTQSSGRRLLIYLDQAWHDNLPRSYQFRLDKIPHKNPHELWIVPKLLQMRIHQASSKDNNNNRNKVHHIPQIVVLRFEMYFPLSVKHPMKQHFTYLRSIKIRHLSFCLDKAPLIIVMSFIK